jgi:CrcB protein
MSWLTQVLLVAGGGAAGAVSRYLIATWLARHAGTHFPWGTLAVNLTGCFLIGMFIQSSLYHSDPWKLAFAIGFLGALTTFSAFGAESVSLFQNEQRLAALMYIAASLIVGLSAVWLGMWLIKPPGQL